MGVDVMRNCSLSQCAISHYQGCSQCANMRTMDRTSLFHRRLGESLDKSGKSRKAISEAAGMNPRALKDVFERPSFPKVDNAKQLASALGTSVAYLIGETDDASATVPVLKSPDAAPLTGHQVSAAPSAEDDPPVLVLSFDTSQAGVVELLLTEADARLLLDDMSVGIEILAARRRQLSSSHPSSA